MAARPHKPQTMRDTCGETSVSSGGRVTGVQWISFEAWRDGGWLYLGYDGERMIERMELTDAEVLILLSWARQMYYGDEGRFHPDRRGWTWWVSR